MELYNVLELHKGHIVEISAARIWNGLSFVYEDVYISVVSTWNAI